VLVPENVAKPRGKSTIPGAPADQFGMGRGPARWTPEYLLNLEVPVIAAVNGPCNAHADMPLMSDIVLAAEEAEFSDCHVQELGMVPGDGAAVLWASVMGWNRAKYFHWMGTVITAQQALSLGIVNEVLPRSQLMPRARDIAEQLLRIPSLTRRFTRLVLTQRMRRHFFDEYRLGYTLQTLAATEGMGKVRDSEGA
jgi:enoyl-CoA hydratase/carnithine racemase